MTKYFSEYKKTVAERNCVLTWSFCRCVEVLRIHVFLIVSSKIFIRTNKNGRRELFLFYWIHFLGNYWEHWEQSDPIYHCSCLSHHSSGKYWNDNPDQYGSPAAHTLVLLPQPPLLLWPLLFHSHQPYDAGGPICHKQINFFLWLCSAILGLLYPWRFWVSPAGSDGLWAVQDHQQALALCSQHVQWGVLPAHGWSLPSGDGRCSDTHDISIPLMFCGSNEINYFFCDLLPRFLLFWSDIQVNELALFIVFGFIELSTISGVLVSYCFIILSVLKIHSDEGRFKAFSTCTSHLTAVAIFQGTMLFMYFRPSSTYSLDQDKITSLFYTRNFNVKPSDLQPKEQGCETSLRKIKFKRLC